MPNAAALWVLWALAQTPPDAGTPELETVVTASRAEPEVAATRAVTVLEGEQLLRRSARTTPEALLEAEGVFLQKTNHGGGAPIVRGLYGQQLLLLVDGVRLNNSTVRAGPNQFLNTVDPFLVERMEVLRGPGSVRYGSDALGGVVNVRTYWPRFRSELGVEGRFRGQTSSADTSLQGHLRADLSLPDTAVSASITGRDFNDLTGGGRVGLQRYTAYEEADAALKVRQRLAPNSELSAQYQAVRQQNAPRLDRSTPGDFRRFSEQFRDLGQLRYLGRALGPLERLEVDLSLHRQGDTTDRFRVTRDRIDSDRISVWTVGGRAEGTLSMGEVGSLVVGADAYFDSLSGSFVRTPVTDPDGAFELPEEARYPGSPAAQSFGAFALLQSRGQRPLSWHAGARTQLNRTALPEDPRLNLIFSDAAAPPPVFPEAVVLTPGLAAEAGVRYRHPSGLQGILNLGTGFRAPNVDDFLRLGAEGPGFLVPGRDLVAEQSYTAEVGLGWGVDRTRLQAWYAFTVIPGMIGNLPTTVDGEAFNPDGLPYLQRANRDSATLHAVEASAQWQLHRSLVAQAHATWTLGSQRRRDLTAPGQPLIDEPLSRIPPLNGLLRLTWEPLPWVFLEGVARGATRQDRLSEGDHLDLRICPESFACQGTPGFLAFHLRAGASLFDDRLTAAITLQNLTDATFRAHGSGVDDPGRSVALSLEGRL